MGSRTARVFGLLALFCLSLTIFLGKSSESTLPATDAATHAALALNATAHGVVPRLPLAQEAFGGHWGAQGFNDHPFAFFWLSGWVMRWLGPDAWSAKLVPCLFSVACVMLTVALGAALRGFLFGLIAGLILTLTREFVIDGLNAHLDNVMLAFVLGSFVLWEAARKRDCWGRALIAGLVAGMGMWFKSPVALLPVPALLAAEAWTGELRKRLRFWLLLAAGAVVSGAAIWVLTGAIGGWDIVRDYWVRQLWGTAVGGRGGAQQLDPFLFWNVLRSRFMPWTLLLLASVVLSIRARRVRERDFAVPAAATLVLVLFVSLVRFKYEHYFVPAYPFLALLAARPAAAWLQRWEERFHLGFAAVTMVLVTVLLCTPVSLSPESFPALKRFMAVIQSSGSCSDRVLFVDGYQPYGQFPDYQSLIDFYTGRQVVRADCAEASRLAAQSGVAWILVSGPNFDQCLDANARSRFRSVYAYSDQYLLGTAEPGARIDLTPLSRELKAARDCQAAPLSQDRYHRPAK